MRAEENRKSLRRKAFECYAKAVACDELGGEFTIQSKSLAAEGLRLLQVLDLPEAEDEELKAELEKLI